MTTIKKIVLLFFGIILCAFYIRFFPIKSVATQKYTRAGAVAAFFEKHFPYFDAISFGKGDPSHPFGTTNFVNYTLLGQPRTEGERYKGTLEFHIYRDIGNLFQFNYEMPLSGIIVYAEQDIIAQNPRPTEYKTINLTTHDHWYYVEVYDDFSYF
ncbi:MAG: hypothetical protein IJ191_07935 [Treponema sp.]|nr:hypothetical protein [Treponema sp.]